MKKLKLKALELGATELLTREQLKNVLGGAGSVGTSQACHNQCGIFDCASGQVCVTRICPDDNRFTHVICVDPDSVN